LANSKHKREIMLGKPYIRLLLPLAFASPSFMEASADGTAPPGITIT
jgi:hypothetical protein